MLRISLSLVTLLSMPLAQANEAQALFKSKPCVACHSVESQMLGPAFKEVASRYAGDANALERITKSIKSGSSGQWGTLAMPPNMVSDEEANILAKWILAQ